MTVRRVFVPFFLVALLVAAWAAHAAAHPTVDVVAANWKFTPAKITIPLGEPTTLRLTSSAGVHGIASEELGIPNTTIMPGKFTEVTFTPKKAGEYLVHCSIMCGAGHDKMILTIEVQ
ncbi:cytochrome c oxidase subunit II [bacterium]|nr:MAG: cytochrome c oxidase subunit II [bacterium]